MLDKNNYDSFFIKLLLEICAGSIGLLPLDNSARKMMEIRRRLKRKKKCIQ